MLGGDWLICNCTNSSVTAAGLKRPFIGPALCCLDERQPSAGTLTRFFPGKLITLAGWFATTHLTLASGLGSPRELKAMLMFYRQDWAGVSPAPWDPQYRIWLFLYLIYLNAPQGTTCKWTKIIKLWLTMTSSDGSCSSLRERFCLPRSPGFSSNKVYPWDSRDVLWTQTLHPPLHRQSGESIMSEFSAGPLLHLWCSTREARLLQRGCRFDTLKMCL